MKKFSIADIKKAKEFLNSVNEVPLKEITFLNEAGEPIVIQDEIVEEFRFIGLSNCDFILSGFYKDGYDYIKTNEILPRA